MCPIASWFARDLFLCSFSSLMWLGTVIACTERKVWVTCSYKLDMGRKAWTNPNKFAEGKDKGGSFAWSSGDIQVPEADLLPVCRFSRIRRGPEWCPVSSTFGGSLKLDCAEFCFRGLGNCWEATQWFLSAAFKQHCSHMEIPQTTYPSLSWLRLQLATVLPRQLMIAKPQNSKHPRHVCQSLSFMICFSRSCQKCDHYQLRNSCMLASHMWCCQKVGTQGSRGREIIYFCLKWNVVAWSDISCRLHKESSNTSIFFLQISLCPISGVVSEMK